MRDDVESIALEGDLNRGMSLRFRWTKPGQTPPDLARFFGRSGRLQLECVYAFG